VTLAAIEFDYIRSLVRERSALMLELGKEYLVESRLCPLARQEGFPSLGHFVDQLRATPFGALHRRLVEAMTTNETTFFRDVRPFEVLRTVVLPGLISKQAPDRCLNIWFAACSTGQEPYSVAIMIRDHFPSLLGWNLRLIASDLSRDVLARARRGSYTQLEVNRGLSAVLLLKYFKQQGATWEISPEIRRMVEFSEINLFEPWPTLPRMDMIFMRNVMIYFDVEVKKTILAEVRRLLKPDGFLLLGGAESTFNLVDSFEPLPFDRPGWYRLRQGNGQ
jgi:chemotaxis protein methyltransferase CheR